MLVDDQDEPRKKSTVKNLELLSVEELEGYILALGVEIERAKMIIERRKQDVSTAQALFRK